MADKQNLFRSIPQVDRLLQEENIQALASQWGDSRLYASIQNTLQEVRADISAGKITRTDEISFDAIYKRVEDDFRNEGRQLLRPVINCTGISLHTNLGRSPLSDELMDRVSHIARSYSNLEYRLDLGRRGSRYDALEKQIRELLGVEAAMVVNNNAAAVMLMLRVFARDKEAIVSRGELVEIGGKFRVPEVMEESGARLREVGTTNKTHLDDYEAAINDETGCILKVHRSNFRLEGFHEEVDLNELVALAQEKQVLLMYDLGSGLMHPEPPAILRDEPTVQEAVASGCDLISFSGDKLLGGPQAGIIVGRKDLIEKIKANPLTRALRCDKLTLVALQETLKLYPDVNRINSEIPLFRMLSASDEEIIEKNGILQAKLQAAGITSKLATSRGEVGGGSAPGLYFTTPVLALESDQNVFSLKALEEELRRGDLPIIAFIQFDQLIFDLRTVEANQLDALAQGIIEAAKRAI